MKRLRILPLVLLAPLAQAQDGALSGPTGLLTVPTAQVVDEGTVRTGMSWHDSVPAQDGVVNYLFNVGFAPGLELGGRLAQFGSFGGQPNDLSFNAKLRLWQFDSGLAFAVGGEDLGGAAQNFRSRYVVATLPWRTLSFTAGYGAGPDLLDGALGGIAWQPSPWLGLYAEYDADEVNPGLRLQSPPLWAGLRLGANVGYRGATDEVEGGIGVSIPLGRRPSPAPAPARAVATPPLPDEAPQIQTQALDDRPAAPSPSLFAEGLSLRAALEHLGFEAVRTGTRGGDTWVVALENRRYNHSAADGIGLALGTIATRAPPGVARVELLVVAYGVPQVVVATEPRAYREFLRDGVAAPGLVEARYAGGAGSDVRWHNDARLLDAVELVVEPVLRTFVATEYGMLDAGLGARARLTAPLANGLVAHVGVQVPVALSDDFHDGRNFAPVAPDAGLDLLLAQYAQKLAPSWTALWSVGIVQVYQSELRTAALEQLWASPEGRHRLNAKVMVLDSEDLRHKVALAGYTWFDATRRYSAALTGGRFYADDSGVRLDVNRYFDDTIAGIFLKVEAHDSMAAGFQLSLPLTPRRDAPARGVQVKGPRRWGHSLQTTLNLADGSNALKPLLLYEPVTEFDLRRDFLDSNRLGPEWLRGQLPRLREAWLLWGGD